MNLQTIQKNYYQQLMVGHYIDVRYSEYEWKIAKITQRDKRYAKVLFDAFNCKDQQVLLNSHKVAPLRMHTQNYTGSIYRPHRTNTPISQYKHHLQIIKQNYLKDILPSAFTITQYLRGDFFVLVHALLCRQDLSQEQGAQANRFLISFVQVVAQLAKKIKSYSRECLDGQGNHKLSYLINPKLALANAFSEIVWLLNLCVRAQTSKILNIFRNRLVNQDSIINFFNKMQTDTLFFELFNLNDGQGRWLSFSLLKRLYFLLKKQYGKVKLPQYKAKDYLTALQVFPFIIAIEQKDNKVQQDYLNYMITILSEGAPFQCQLRCLQQLKKLIQGQTKLFKSDDKKIYTLMGNKQLVDKMLNQYNFNPQIFKRFIPILQNYCKVKSFNTKNITILFKLAQNRHESEVLLIHEIIYALAEFMPTQVLDTTYAEIIKNNLNIEQHLNFVKNFTVKAISNYSKQKSFFATLFRKNKNSSKYGYYGLDMFFKEIQDQGVINGQNILFVVQLIRQIFTSQIFQTQRDTYIGHCVSWLEKGKNVGQAIKLLNVIISTFPSQSFFGNNRKQIISSLLQKNQLLTACMISLKKGKNINERKIKFIDVLKYLYQFMQNYIDELGQAITAQHIQFLWSLNHNRLIAEFIKKTKGEGKKKYYKRLTQQVQAQILTKLVKKPIFNQKNQVILPQQFEAFDELFISLNLNRKKIQISQRGIMRYLSPDMQGYNFYFQFLPKLHSNDQFQRLVKKTINIFLRPKNECDIDTKTNLWKSCLLQLLQKLKQYPQCCLKTIRLFFEMIEGTMSKQIANASGNIQVGVSFNQQQKIIVLPKNSTIFRLRKQIMKQFGLDKDFTLYSLNMKRDITFAQQQEYSLNALPLESRGSSISIVNPKQQKHPHFAALELFKAMIQKQQNFYSSLFALNCEAVQDFFWKTIDLLPVNRQLIRKIQRCDNFSIKQWQQLLINCGQQALQYHLNIIYDLFNKNQQYAVKFDKSGGLVTLAAVFLVQLQQNVIMQRIVNRCILIALKIFKNLQIEKSLKQQFQNAICQKLSQIFKNQVQISSSIIINIDLLNNMFKLLSKVRIVSSSQPQKLSINIMLKILTYGIFKPRNKITVQFSQGDFQSYLINNYSQLDRKLQIYSFLLKHLQINNLIVKQNCQLFFSFLIDYMNTFQGQEQSLVLTKEHAQIIQNFIWDVLEGSYSDTSTYQHNQILYGAFRLLLFVTQLGLVLDNNRLFNIFLHQFLFNRSSKRINFQNTSKMLYQALKKILFANPNLLDELINEVAPRLQSGQWRLNYLSSWSLQQKKQQRSLFCGLQNQGATCYINCLIQQMFMIQQFRQKYISIDSSKYRPLKQQNQMLQLQTAFSNLKHNSKKSISLKKFTQSFITYEGTPINPMVQSDADQFFNALMEKVETFLKQQGKHSILQDTFEGQLSNQLNCEECPHRSQKTQPFLSVGINIRGKKTLQQALQGYVQGQILDGNNAYFCQPCQKKVRTTKRLCFKKLPNILVIVIKRFQFNYDQMRKIKINSYLKFPFDLNMAPYTAAHLASEIIQEGSCDYSLRGTVIHSGTSQGGHYHSLIKNGQKWYSFNDEFVQLINQKKVQEDGYGGQQKNDSQFKYEKYRNAYILFYEKKKPSNQFQVLQQSQNQFVELLKNQVLNQNNNQDFLSVMLDSNFVRLVQNLSALQHPQAGKFTMLYYHTAVLRDKSRDQYLPHYYRIMTSLLSTPSFAQWYLSQINAKYFKQFLIEAPRIVRYQSTGLITQAIKKCEKLPQNFIQQAMSCLKRQNMTPFCLIFKTLSLKESYKVKLLQLKYSQKALKLVLNLPNLDPVIPIQSFQSYFGSQSSQKEKQRQICISSLVQSLEQFDIDLKTCISIYQQSCSRNGNKILAKKISKIIDKEGLQNLYKTLQTKLYNDGYKKQDIEKCIFLMRFVILSQNPKASLIDLTLATLKRIIYDCRSFYDPMDFILRQMSYFASRNEEFCIKLRAALLQKQQGIDLIKSLKYWLKQAQKPLTLYKNQDFKKKTSSMSLDERHRYESINKQILSARMSWMWQKDKKCEGIDSDIESQCNRKINIRNKQFKIKEHLGLIKKVQAEGKQSWALLQKNQLDLYSSL